MAIPIWLFWKVLMTVKVAEVIFCLKTYQHQRTFQNKCLPSSWSVYFHRIQSRTSIFCQTLPRIPKNLLTHFKALKGVYFHRVQSRTSIFSYMWSCKCVKIPIVIDIRCCARLKFWTIMATEDIDWGFQWKIRSHSSFQKNRLTKTRWGISD